MERHDRGQESTCFTPSINLTWQMKDAVVGKRRWNECVFSSNDTVLFILSFYFPISFPSNAPDKQQDERGSSKGEEAYRECIAALLCPCPPPPPLPPFSLSLTERAAMYNTGEFKSRRRRNAFNCQSSSCDSVPFRRDDSIPVSMSEAEQQDEYISTHRTSQPTLCREAREEVQKGIPLFSLLSVHETKTLPSVGIVRRSSPLSDSQGM